MRKYLAIAVCAGVLAFAASGVNADVITQGPQTYGNTTNWTNNFVFNQFNPGVDRYLTGVTLYLDATMTGSAQFENTSTTSGSTVSGTLAATITVYQPGGTTNAYLQETPSYNFGPIDLTTYDGTFDYGGTSGYTISNAAAGAPGSYITYDIPASDWGLFTGTGSVILPSTANNESTTQISGGTVASVLTTNGSAQVELQYDYGTVPEPGTLALLALGVFGLIGFKRRRRV